MANSHAEDATGIAAAIRPVAALGSSDLKLEEILDDMRYFPESQ